MNSQQDLFLLLLLLCLIGNNNADSNGNFVFGDINKSNDILIIFIILGLFNTIDNQRECCERILDRTPDDDRIIF